MSSDTSSDRPETGTGVQPCTSADVARLAGVSRATVSFVLNDTAGGRVSERTRAKVRAAADQLGYVRHAAARSLRAGHTGLVLLVGSTAPIGPLFSGFHRELQEALSRRGYTGVLLGPTPGGGDAARAWAELRPTAVLCLTPGLTPEGVRMLRRSGTRAVFVLGAPPVDGAHELAMDQHKVGALAAAHLLERGRRRIGVLMPADPSLAPFSAPRLEGVREAAASAGSGVLVEPLPVEYTEESAAELASLCRGLGLDGLFGYNDEYAMLALRALQDAGLDVPGEVALVGADDLLLGRLLRPRLSTVRMRLPSGEELAELVDRVVAEPDAPLVSRDTMSVELVARDSS
ncbi:LacI family DNA-binding transcriptional regulator [Kitasatospora sp. NPDC101183]|uniref:LacI family DNA-binding transcriptional regulator n=1 Tax=Kitasatospora sp. NPDC101183 TaxID=3364100 RepID=UPI0037F74684